MTGPIEALVQNLMIIINKCYSTHFIQSNTKMKHCSAVLLQKWWQTSNSKIWPTVQNASTRTSSVTQLSIAVTCSSYQWYGIHKTVTDWNIRTKSAGCCKIITKHFKTIQGWSTMVLL